MDDDDDREYENLAMESTRIRKFDEEERMENLNVKNEDFNKMTNEKLYVEGHR